MTQKSCAVGMRSAILRNYLNTRTGCKPLNISNKQVFFNLNGEDFANFNYLCPSGSGNTGSVSPTSSQNQLQKVCVYFDY